MTLRRLVSRINDNMLFCRHRRFGRRRRTCFFLRGKKEFKPHLKHHIISPVDSLADEAIDQRAALYCRNQGIAVSEIETDVVGEIVVDTGQQADVVRIVIRLRIVELVIGIPDHGSLEHFAVGSTELQIDFVDLFSFPVEEDLLTEQHRDFDIAQCNFIIAVVEGVGWLHAAFLDVIDLELEQCFFAIRKLATPPTATPSL